jgi:SAM-dependent methyltransferase
LTEVQQTHGEAERALDENEVTSELLHDNGVTPPSNVLHPVVRGILGATSGHLYYPIRNLIDHYPIPDIRLPAANDGETLLDIGCNWGRWCVAAARRGYKVVGIDPSFGALVVARRVLRQLGITDVTFACADSRYLPFQSDSFDAIFSYNVIQHFCKADAKIALTEIGRVLRSGGKSLIQMPSALGIRSLYHQARRGFREPQSFEVRYWLPRELLRVFDETIGSSHLSIDGFFGLGIQASDLPYFLPHHRLVVMTSEFLRRRVRFMMPFADSLYVESTKPCA